MLLADASLDEARPTIPACADFNLSLTAKQENAVDLYLHPTFIVKQMMPRLGWKVQSCMLLTF